MADSVLPLESIRTWQKQLLRGVLRALVIVGFLAVVVSSYYATQQGLSWLIPMYGVAYAILLLLAFWQRVPYELQAGAFMVLLYGLAIVDFATEGRGASARLFLLAILFAGTLFFGWRGGVFTMALILLTMVGFGWAFSTGRITDYQEVSSTEPAGWVSNIFVLFMLGAFIMVSLNYLVPRLMAALARSRQLAQKLEENQSRLEDQVRERTVDLERRSTQLEAAAQVAREAAEIRDVEQLLKQIVDLISDRFGFYHTGIFLLDEAGEYAVLRAVSSEGGRRMLARGHNLRVGHVGIVGYVTGAGEHRIALDVGEDAVFFDNPDLPETRSEMALPLRVRGEIIGALDVQSKEPEAFAQEDVTVLQTLADQAAVAIENARLLAESQAALEATQRIYGEISREAWEEMLRTRTGLSARYDPRSILPSDERQREEMKLAIREERPIEQLDVIAVPLKVRGQVIGVLDAHKPENEGEWTPEQIELLETLSDQLGAALESARLYQDTQRRAARERLTGEITDRMRRAVDIEELMQNAVTEIAEALGTPGAFVQLGALSGSLDEDKKA